MFTARFLQKKPYGYDEFDNASKDAQQKNIRDGPDANKTPLNRVSTTKDIQAEVEYPGLRSPSNLSPSRRD